MVHRRGVGVFLILVLAVAFVAACGDDDSASSDTTATTTADDAFARMPISWRPTCPRSTRSSCPAMEPTR